jgi:hypothetical protein
MAQDLAEALRLLRHPNKPHCSVVTLIASIRVDHERKATVLSMWQSSAPSASLWSAHSILHRMDIEVVLKSQ